MQIMDKISVIIPAYNAEKTIGKCLNSVLSNKICEEGGGGAALFDIQVIVVNDGSVDETLAIINDIAYGDSRVKVLSQKNSGVAVAKEVGLQYSTGNYITFCDSDDYVEPDWLSSMYICLKKFDADIVRYRVIFDGLKTQYKPGEILVWDKSEAIKEFLIHKKINGVLCSGLFKRELFNNVHFNPLLCIFEDADVMWKLIHNASKIVRVNDAKYHYVIDGDSLSNGKTNINKINSSLNFWDSVANDVVNNAELHLLAQKKQTEIYLGCLKGMLLDGVRDVALESKMKGLLKEHLKTVLDNQKTILKRLFCMGCIYMPEVIAFVGKLK